MIADVLIEPLKTIQNEKGSVMHMLRNDASFFKSFGEVYFSKTNPGMIKGWKKHLKQTQHFAVPIGQLKLVLYDDREGSKTHGEIQEIELGEADYKLVRIPNNVWYGFSAVGDGSAMIVNCTDVPHDPDESIHKDLTDRAIPYQWDFK